MIQIYAADTVEELAAGLSALVVGEPLDPMVPEWLAVPSEGLRRWVHLALARHLGASAGGAGDGVAANIVHAFPSSLRRAFLEAGAPDGVDPWAIDRMVWHVLATADAEAVRGGTTVVAGPDGVGVRFDRARRVADLFDRYHLHRPEMIRAWAEGRDVDGADRPLAGHALWQARLWRQVRERIGAPSPPELLPGLVRRVASGEVRPGLPPRLLFFGFTSLPDRAFVELAGALPEPHQCHLFLLEPVRVRSGPPPGDGRPGPRLLRSGEAVAGGHPLVRSWGLHLRESSRLLADACASGRLPEPVRPDRGRTATGTLLARVHDAVRADAPPRPSPVDPADRSVQFHACYGPMRQVQVARDTILHLLAEEDDLTEEDVLVVCPDLDTFAPLVDAVFPGPSVAAAGDGPGTGDAPALRYRIADQSVRSVNPVLAAAAALFDLVGGRYESGAVLDFLSLEPVCGRFGFDEDELATVAEWVGATSVRWGLDAAHRTAFGLPESVTANTWAFALDRLLLGVTTAEVDLALAVGGSAPFGVEGGDVALLGRLAAALGHLTALGRQASAVRTVDEWVVVLRGACHELLAPPFGESWQMEALDRLLAEVLDEATVGGVPAPAPLGFADVRSLVARKFEDRPGRPAFFTGGVTVTSLLPMRWVPHRVVCLLGVDQAAFTPNTGTADDLLLSAPQLGDPDPRADVHQSLLAAVLAATDHLVVVRTGRDVRTNRPVPMAVPVAELADAVRASCEGPDGADPGWFDIHHPRHPFDERCLIDGALGGGGPWSFAAADRRAAEARRARRDRPEAEVVDRVPVALGGVVDLDDLRRFLADPVQAFVTSTLQATLPGPAEPDAVGLPVGSRGRELADLGNRLLVARRSGATTDAWLRYERALGALPAGSLEARVRRAVEPVVDALLEVCTARDVRAGPPDARPVDLVLPDGTRLVGTVGIGRGGTRPGPARVQFSRVRPRHHLAAWVELMALVASDPAVPWHSLVAGRPEHSTPDRRVEWIDLVPAERSSDGALSALGVAVDLFRRGLTEPLPLFPTFSPTLLDRPDLAKWRSFQGWGDADGAAARFFFGHLDDFEVLELPPRDDDPGRGADRASRLARYLWLEVRRSSRDLNDAPRTRRPAAS